MNDKTPEEKAYIKGFYAASKGVLFCLDDREATIENVRDAVQSTLDEMEADGDFEGMESDVDLLIDLVKEAEAMGKTNELFNILDKHFGGK